MLPPKHHFDFMRSCLLLAGVLCTTGAVPITAAAQETVEPPDNTVWSTTIDNPNPNGFDTPDIMNALYNPHSDLVLLSSHRGNHAIATNINQDAGVPENSLQAIGLAAQAGWEMIELDVAITSDNVPILTHDATWGREWCGLPPVTYPELPYNPFIPPGASTPNDLTNANVSATALADTRSFFGHTVLRDYVSLVTDFSYHGCDGSRVLFGEYPPTLADALNYIAQNKIRMVVLLDIRTPNIAAAAFNVVSSMNDDAGRPFLKSVIFKMPANYLPHGYSDFVGTFGPQFGLVNFIPVINTAQVAPTTTGITEPEDDGSDLSSVGTNGLGGEPGIVSWLTDMETNTQSGGPIHMPAVEINLKEPGGILTGTVLPFATTNHQTNTPMTIGIYNPIGDYFTNGDTTQTKQYFRQPDGSCCITLAAALYNNPNNTGPIDPSQPVDNSDHREDLNFITNSSIGAQYIISDDPASIATLLQQKGQRNICYMQPACNTQGVGSGSGGSGGQGVGPGSGGDGGQGVGPGLNSSNNQLTSGNQFPGIYTILPTPTLTQSQFNFSGNGSDTFTVNAGGTSFTATQPNDSVATYVWQDGGSPSEWLTNAYGTSLQYALQYVPVANYAGVSPTDIITVNAGTTYQTIDGFGGAMTDSAASLIQGSQNPSSIMQTLFGTGAGDAGLTMVRSPMGSSDMMASPNDIHTYEDTPGSFSANAYASDQRQIAALQQAQAIVGSNFKLLGTPWSAPGWAKFDGSLLPPQCGTQQNEFGAWGGDQNDVQQYAAYFTSYVNAYASAGLTPWAVSMQNEPENCKTTMPTTLMSATDEVALATALKSQLPDGVKVLGWDHNWNDEDFVNTLVNSGQVDMIGYHCYDGTHYGNQTQAVPTYLTECSGFTNETSNVATNLGWEVANLLIGPLRYGSRGAFYWSLAQDPNGNPHLNAPDACQDCRGIITVNSDGSFYPSQDLFYWAQFSKFITPGSVRIDSNNSGNLSTVAFRNGTTNILVVLNSMTSQANGGSPGSDERDLRGYILNWDGDNSAQKTAWLVGSDGHRRWVSDIPTFSCLQQAGMIGPVIEASGALDKYINLMNVWAVCGATTMGTDSELEVGTYLQSTHGARLTLSPIGLTSVDSAGNTRWTPPGGGNRLILQEDGNLVLYAGTTVTWASNTAGSGAVWLSIRDDGTFALFNSANQEVWVSEISPATISSYRGKMVQWDGDTSSQPTSWQVGFDGNRRWVPDLPTFQCLHDGGEGNSLPVSSDILNSLPNLQNVWATCGGTQIGANGALDQGGYMKAGGYALVLQWGNLVEYDPSGNAIWSVNSSTAVELILQNDGNLVLYDANRNPVWSTGTNGTSPGWFFIGSDGSLVLYDGNGNPVWSEIPSETLTSYRGKMVQWNGDTSSQPTSWQVGFDGNRRWIPDLPTYQCLQNAGEGNSIAVNSVVLNSLPNLNNVWATCGGNNIGANGALDQGGYMKAGGYALVLQWGNLVEYDPNGNVVWATGTFDAVELILQNDGNLVLYDANRNPLWSTGTSGTSPGWFFIGSNGTLTLYNASGNQIWGFTAPVN